MASSRAVQRWRTSIWSVAPASKNGRAVEIEERRKGGMRKEKKWRVVSGERLLKPRGARKLGKRDQGSGVRGQGRNRNTEPQSGIRTPVESTGLPKPEMNADSRR